MKVLVLGRHTTSRTVHWPELILATMFAVILLFYLLGTASEGCLHWRERLNSVAGAFLTNTITDQPLPDSPETIDRLRDEARQVLDERPLGCL